MINSENYEVTLGEVFGFCDGINIYVYPAYRAKEKILNKSLFVKMEHPGRYCYYDDIDLELNIGATLYLPDVAVGMGASEEKVKILSAIDFNTGQRLTVTEENIKHMIAGDAALVTKYSETPKDEIDLKAFLKAYANDEDTDRNDYQGYLDHLHANIFYHDTDSTLDQFITRIRNLETRLVLNEIELWESHYGSGQLKFIGLKATHNEAINPDYLYRIGTWIDFHKNGQIKRRIDYNLKEQKHGRVQTFDKLGNILEEKYFMNDVKMAKYPAPARL